MVSLAPTKFEVNWIKTYQENTNSHEPAWYHFDLYKVCQWTKWVFRNKLNMLPSCTDWQTLLWWHQETSSWSLHIQTNKSVRLFKKNNNKKHPSLHTQKTDALTDLVDICEWIIPLNNIFKKSTHKHTHKYTHIHTHTNKLVLEKIEMHPSAFQQHHPLCTTYPLCSTLHIHPNGRPASDTMISKTVRDSKQVQRVPGERQQRWLGNTGCAKTGDTGACCTGTPLSFAAQQTVFCKYTNTRAVLSESHHNTQTHP